MKTSRRGAALVVATVLLCAATARAERNWWGGVAVGLALEAAMVAREFSATGLSVSTYLQFPIREVGAVRGGLTWTHFFSVPLARPAWFEGPGPSRAKDIDVFGMMFGLVRFDQPSPRWEVCGLLDTGVVVTNASWAVLAGPGMGVRLGQWGAVVSVEGAFQALFNTEGVALMMPVRMVLLF